jgi:tetratricopeptide (TPR) repeat protein
LPAKKRPRPDKEHVLEALNQVSTAMRAKLGESLSSIQRLNAPFGQATTPSLEAFRAYALGDEAHQKGNDIPEAYDHYKRALELDPKLAMAWARLGVLKLNTWRDYRGHAKLHPRLPAQRQRQRAGETLHCRPLLLHSRGRSK